VRDDAAAAQHLTATDPVIRSGKMRAGFRCWYGAAAAVL